MDCCICSPVALLFRPPRNTICLRCYEAAKGMYAVLNGDSDQRMIVQGGEGGGDADSRPAADNQPRPRQQPKSLAEALRWMKQAKAAEDALRERLNFLESFAAAFGDGLHADILVHPGSGPPIPAHRALLASKSEILRTMLGGSDDDPCKAPAGASISLPDLTHAQLRAFLAFLYSGTLPDAEADQHAAALLLAGDKYDVPALRRFCERRLLASLRASNALDALETADSCAEAAELREEAMAVIGRYAESVVFSERYEAFAAKNAHLCVEITRMLIRQMGPNSSVEIKEEEVVKKTGVLVPTVQQQNSQGVLSHTSL